MVIVEVEDSGLKETILSRFVHRARKAVGLQGAVSVLVIRGDEMRRLNSRFRKKNKSTDVLSFPSSQPMGANKKLIAGDVAVCWNIAHANARKLGHSAEEEVKVLILHGVLHLAGYDHENDKGDMAKLEARLRVKLKLPITLTERNTARGKSTRTSAVKALSPRLRRRRKS